MIRGIGDETVVGEGGGAVDADRARAERGDVERRAVGGDRHPEREGEARVVLGVGRRGAARRVVDVLVQVPRHDAAARLQDRDAALGEMAAHARRLAGRFEPGREGPRALEAHVVEGLEIRHVVVAVYRIHDHVEENRPNALPIAGGAGDRRRRVRRRVDREDVAIGQREAHDAVPAAAALVAPVAAVEFHDQPDLGLGDALEVRVRRRQAARRSAAVLRAVRRGAAVGYERGVHGRRTVAGVEDRGVDAAAVGRRGERARRVAEERDDRLRRAAEAAAEARRVEDPHVGAAGPWGREDAHDRRLEGRVLPAVRGRDERARRRAGARRTLAVGRARDAGVRAAGARARPGEDDVPRLVADEERADDVRGRG